MLFQYPRSDRAHCNTTRPPSKPPEQSRLSVSSVGSSPLQRYGAPHTYYYLFDFQYPRSDRAHCNSAWRLFDPPPPHLSVSLVGSSPLQRRSTDSAASSLEGLSVSSVGSSPLQLEPSHRKRRGSTPFSILGRIEPTATSRTGLCAPKTSLLFQYPRSDRAHCNRQTPLRPSRPLPPFSILGRIEPTATRISSTHPLPSRIFQYPRSDRAHCNHRRGQDEGTEGDLSVSSVGSSPLQRLIEASAVGLSGAFSILGRIEPTATCRHSGGGFGKSPLSVSSVGSSPLQLLLALGASHRGWLSVSSVGSSPLQPSQPSHR